MKAILLLASTFLAAACTATAPQKQDGPQAAQDGLICRDEAELGTKFKTRVCETKEQAQARKERGQEITQQIQAGHK
jgi:hypothetical protein